MKNRNKKIKIIGITSIFAIISIIVVLFTFFVKKVDNSSTAIDPEILRSTNYTQITDEDAKIENCEYVKFSAFFTRDLNNDENAEKLLGTCRSVNNSDVLYMDLNVISNGYLKDGKITINGTNFKYSMSMVKDSVLKNNYISDDVKEIELKQVNAGTQKLILGNVLPNIGNNVNNYSRINSVTLTGTHVSDEGVETKITKTLNLTVDWHGETRTDLYIPVEKIYYDHTKLTSTTVSFSFRLTELQEELILKENIATATIPELSGYSPIEVKCTNNNVEYEYNEETRVITIKRSSSVAEDRTVTNLVSRNNTYSVSITYPKEAYDAINSYATLTIPVKGYYTGYNNPNGEFQNPYKSNEPEGKVSIVFRKEEPTGYVYNFYVNIVDKKYVSKPSYRYVISKQDLLNLYDSDEEIQNKEYVISWQAVRGNLGEVSSMVMSETKAQESYGDKWDTTIMENYTSNVGVYFSGADGMLGEDGTISIYNNDTNELIKTFTKEEWNSYSRENPFRYEEPVKHIRIETSKANLNSSLTVYNVKELDVNKILQDFTKQQVKDVEVVYTYLTGVCNMSGGTYETLNKMDYAYYVSEKSYASLDILAEKISTQETYYNQKIYITTSVNQVGDAKWKNGEFIVEIPEEIVNMEINNVTVNNSNINIVAYDLSKKDGKYLIKILTENAVPETYKITIDCNMAPDPRIPTSSRQLKLYAYNQYCNDYYYEGTDIYDVDGDNNVEEVVGTSSTNIALLSPTSLITLETVSNYNEEGEITIAPNVAEVERGTRQATINIGVTNNYPNTVTGVQILGKIPFEGNTYVINGKDMKSEFTVAMAASGIQVPNELQDKTVVYYSENENPTKNLEDTENGWTLLENVQDFSKIKTYLIDMQEFTIEVGKEVNFNYVVSLPENIDYNLASYSNHAVYYELNTEGGKLSLSTEPNKVGVRIVKMFDLELTKYKIYSELTIPGVTYLLKYNEENEEGELQEKTRILTTNAEGKVILENLHVGVSYTLQEIKVPNTCELNSSEISFTINEDSSVTFNGNARNYEFSINGEILKIELEDEVKYNVEINKTKIGTNLPINNVRFLVVDENGNKVSARTQNGVAILEGLSLNKEYTISETVVPGNCELNEGTFKFKLVRNSNNIIELVTIENSLTSGVPTVQDSESMLTPVLKLNVQNEIKYSLNLTKQDLEGNAIGGVEFTIKGKGFQSEGTKYTTSREGKISVLGLYVGETYTLEETKAFGYYLDSTKNNTIQFKIDRIDGKMQITKWLPGEGIVEVGEKILVESETDLTASISTILQNEKVPTYNLKIVKENEDGEKLQGAQFKLTSLDTGVEQTITIDENGEGTFEGLYEYIEGKCITGEYTLQETYAPEGYAVDSTILKFKASRDENEKVVFTIIEGNSLIKTDSETSEKAISVNENGATITIVNEPIFKLKKYGDNNCLLPNAKFTITDLNGNSVTDINGKTVGTDEIIDGKSYKVVLTDEKGEISVDLPEGLYKAVEVEAPEGYNLPSDEKNRTYYFGIGESRPAETSGKVDSIKWANSVKSNLVSEFNDAIETEDGGIIAVGDVEENIDIDGDGIADTASVGNKDAVIVKYDANGNIEWSKILGGINDDELYAIAKVPTGGYVIAGYSSTSEVYYNGTLIDMQNFGNEDGIIVKIDENGNYLWSQTIGGTGTDRINDVAVSENGDIAVVGSYYNTTLYTDKDKTESLTNLGNKDGFISVYTSDGIYSWAQNIGGTSDVFGKAVTWTQNGVVVRSEL